MKYPYAIQRILEAQQGNTMNAETTTNFDVILWALYDLGGDEKFVDIEDIFLKLSKLLLCVSVGEPAWKYLT